MESIDNIIIISSTIEKGTCFYGLGLESGITLIPPKYEDVKFPIGDIFMFRQNGKWGLMSLNGDVLLTPEYDNIFSWNEKYIVVGEGKSYHYKCGVVDWSGCLIIPIEHAAIELTAYSVFRCYTSAEHDWGHNHQMDFLKYDGNPYLWKNNSNETLGKQLQIWRNNQQVANYNGWLILDNQILLNPELESQKWVSDKDLNFIQVTPDGNLITKDKRGKYGLRDLSGKSIVLQIYDDMKLMPSGIVVLYNGKIGIVGTNGNSILPTEYLEIRDNVIDESNKEEIKGDWSWVWNIKNGFAYRYSKDHPLDTSNLETIIVRSDFFISDGIIACCKKGESQFNTFITRNGDGENIFSIENGFVLEENADKIIPLTSDD